MAIRKLHSSMQLTQPQSNTVATRASKKASVADSSDVFEKSGRDDKSARPWRVADAGSSSAGRENERVARWEALRDTQGSELAPLSREQATTEEEAATWARPSQGRMSSSDYVYLLDRAKQRAQVAPLGKLFQAMGASGLESYSLSCAAESFARGAPAFDPSATGTDIAQLAPLGSWLLEVLAALEAGREAPPAGEEVLSGFVRSITQASSEIEKLRAVCAGLELVCGPLMTSSPTPLFQHADLAARALDGWVTARILFLQRATASFDPAHESSFELEHYLAFPDSFGEAAALRDLSVLAPARARELGRAYLDALRAALNKTERSAFYIR